MFGFDMVLPMNTGAEAVETAIKLARKWGYEKKKIPEGRAKVLSVEGNFHGRTIGIISMSTDPESRIGFGPFLEGVGPQWVIVVSMIHQPIIKTRSMRSYKPQRLTQNTRAPYA